VTCKLTLGRKVGGGTLTSVPVDVPIKKVAKGELMHFLLFYEVSENYLEKRGDFREEHLRLAWEAHERGELILGGALTEPVDCAVLLFKGESSDVAKRFAAADPYVTNGLIVKWNVRPWATVVGMDASSPIRPA
jgi:uncharacterized protein